MTQIIDGTKLAKSKELELKAKLKKIKIKPKIVSFLIGDDPASVLYTNMKQEKANQLGIDFKPLKYPAEVGFEEVANKIKEFNQDDEIIGIMVQLPLPKEFLNSHHTHELLELINPKKDIDGLNPTQSDFIPATVKGVLSILNVILATERSPESGKVKDSGRASLARMTDWGKLVFAVVGSEGEVGQSLVYELTNRGALVIKVDKKLPETSLEDIKNADVVISATGVKNLITADLVKDGVIVVDVGLGDFEKSVYKKAKAYTPKIGGVGPMTVISLMENIVEAANRINNYEL